MSATSSVQDQLLLCGDLNYKDINWETHLVPGGRESDQVKFHDVCQDEYLYQHIQDFTRVRGYDEPSLLDLILTKNPLEIEKLHYKSPIGASDHVVITFDFIT